VVAGGESIADRVRDLPAYDLVIAADSGVDRAHAAGLRIDIAIGDFDSVTPEGLEKAEADGARIETHPSAKAATDLELALEAAVKEKATDIVVVGIGGGPRLDHFIANVLVLASPRFDACDVSARSERARVDVVQGGREPTELVGRVGDLVTLLPIGGDAHGVTTTGLHYPLNHESLRVGSTRGVSNFIETEPASVCLSEGTLLAIVPGQGVEDA
jgi:thiamine pyrophosphokinase